MARFVYSPDYTCDIGAHVFRTDKYRRLHDRLVETGLVGEDEFVRPEPATREDLELVHTRAYVDDLLGGHHTMRTIRSEMPISAQIVRAFILGAGGTIAACRLALREHTLSMNMAGGFHHAFPDRAEGFCYVNDVAVGAARVRRDGLVRRVMIVDCDLHQGNGTAYIFRDQPDVFTLSIHQQSIYPVKMQSDLDIGLPDFCGADRYVQELERGLAEGLERHRPQLVLYVAGADPYREDQLGSLMLDVEDLRRRDELVIGACVERDVPATALLAGGYAPDVQKTVQIHYGTARTLVDMSDRLRAVQA